MTSKRQRFIYTEALLLPLPFYTRENTTWEQKQIQKNGDSSRKQSCHKSK